MSGHGVPNGLLSEWYIGPEKKKMTSLSYCSVLMSGVCSGLLPHKKDINDFHIVVFFDWCSALADNGKSEVPVWWELEDAFACFKPFDNVSILGWNASSTIIENSLQMGWLGSHRDLVSDEALDLLTSGAAASLRRLTVQKGKYVKPPVNDKFSP